MGASVSDGDGAVGCVVVTESSASSKSSVVGGCVSGGVGDSKWSKSSIGSVGCVVLPSLP